jgi:hypothetical protein
MLNIDIRFTHSRSILMILMRNVNFNEIFISCANIITSKSWYSFNNLLLYLETCLEIFNLMLQLIIYLLKNEKNAKERKKRWLFETFLFISSYT